MMLHCGEDDLVARSEMLTAITVGDEVDAFRGAADEDNFAILGRVEKAANRTPRRFIIVRGSSAQFVDGPVDVGTFRRVEAPYGIEDHARLLRRRRVVEIDQR